MRSGRDNFMRNVMIALGNMAQPSQAHIAAIRARLGDASAVVRAHAVWALGRLDPALAKTQAAAYMAQEQDADVLAEWRAVEEL